MIPSPPITNRRSHTRCTSSSVNVSPPSRLSATTKSLPVAWYLWNLIFFTFLKRRCVGLATCYPRPATLLFDLLIVHVVSSLDSTLLSLLGHAVNVDVAVRRSAEIGLL